MALEAARAARAASLVMAATSTATKNAALELMAAELAARRRLVEEANAKDKERAKREGLDAALQSRLNVAGDKFDTLLAGLRALVAAPDPTGKVLMARELAPDLDLYRIATPIGVLCVVFESRPEAAVQIASLAVKSGNAVLLKGGKEASASNEAIVEALRAALEKAGLPKDAVQLVATRDDVQELLKLNKYVDLVIPRGGNALVAHVMRSTTIPVLGHADGICFVYVDKQADPAKAAAVVVDAKTQYPAACNAAETLLVHADLVRNASPAFVETIQGLRKRNVRLVVDARVGDALASCSAALAADEGITRAAADFGFDTEYLELTMSVKTVDSLSDAVAFINEHGSHHTDVVVTEDESAAETFLRSVDSAGVYHNASSRFADGFRYGFGAEVGVSTNRIHARGPVGLEGLLTYKYVLKGKGHVVEGFGPAGSKAAKTFTHVDLPAVVGRDWTGVVFPSSSSSSSSPSEASAAAAKRARSSE